MTQDAGPRTRRDSLTHVLLVGCVALAVCVIALAWQNLALKRRLASPAHAQDDLPKLAAGDVVGPFDLWSPTGESVKVAFDGAEDRTLLLVFSSTCPACERNMPAWHELLSGQRSSGVRVLGIQTDLAAGAQPHAAGPPCPIYSVGQRAGPPFDRLPYVPATVVLDRQGRVRRAWFGILDAQQQAELRRELGA